MTDASNRPPLPDRLSIDPRSPHHVKAIFGPNTLFGNAVRRFGLQFVSNETVAFLIGVLPGHALTGAFFTAPSMVGLIALAGIVVRNSILLVDFIQQAEARGVSLREAVLESGAVRFRPIALTAAAVVVGGIVMVADPIFQGLAIALMSGAVAATLLTMVVVPVLYWELRRHEVARASDPLDPYERVDARAAA